MTQQSATDLAFDTSDRTRGPAYAQVRDEITRRISDGTLAAGVELPAPTTLAASCKTDAGEVQRAYYELERSGDVEKKTVAGFMNSKRTVYVVRSR